MLYYWPGMYSNVEKAMASCAECAKWSPRQYEELSNSTEPPSWPFWQVHLDVQHLPPAGGKKALVEARCGLSGYPEAEALSVVTAKTIYAFLWRYVICRHGVPGILVVDRGSENKGEVEEACKDLAIARLVVSVYNPRANGILEEGHFLIASSLAKMTQGSGKHWPKLISVALLADRTAIRASHGCSSFFIVHGYNPILPMEVSLPSWKVLN